VSCIRCLLYSVLHFFAGHPLHIQIYCATDRALRSRLRAFVVFRCASNQNVFQTKITNNYWRIHLWWGSGLALQNTEEPGLTAKIQLQSFIILGVRWRRVVSFTPRTIYTWITIIRKAFPSRKKLGWPCRPGPNAQFTKPKCVSNNSCQPWQLCFM
jgi:hypothetical protein